MKKILCLVISVFMLVSLFVGCGKEDNGNADTSSIPVSQGETGFVAPESYASVVLVTINPQFKLYLDADGIVLAVEPVNDDAKSINKNIVYKAQTVEKVVQNLVTAASDGGFIKENAKIDVKITSSEAQKVASELANKVKASITAKLDEIKVTAEVTAIVSNDGGTESEKTDSSETSSESSSSDNKNSASSKTESTSSKNDEPVACKHTKTKGVSVSTGKNIIDASKFDVVIHHVVCADCNTVLKAENHTVSNGKCTVCAQSNFATTQVNIIAAAPTYEGYLKVNEDGSPAFEVMLDACWWSAVTPEYTVDDWNYKIPADAMLKAIRTKFVISDAQFEKLKEQGYYHFFLDTHTFKDGYFNILAPAAGGPGEHTHKVVGYSDDKSGKFTVYYDYMSGGADVDEHEHLDYYAVEYNYTGYSNLTIITGEYDIKQIYGYTPVVQSLRVKSIKKVSSLPADMIKVK